MDNGQRTQDLMLSYHDSLSGNIIELAVACVFAHSLPLQPILYVVLYGIVRGDFDSIDLTNKLCYVVPRTVNIRSVRTGTLFALNSCRTNSGLRCPIRRMVESYNRNFIDVDIFVCSKSKFKYIVMKILANNVN